MLISISQFSCLLIDTFSVEVYACDVTTSFQILIFGD